MYSAGKIMKDKADLRHYEYRKIHEKHFVGHFYDDYTREYVYVMTKKLDNFVSQGLSVVHNIRKNNQKSGPSKKGSGAN
jgi:hypothetical protein